MTETMLLNPPPGSLAQMAEIGAYHDFGVVRVCLETDIHRTVTRLDTGMGITGFLCRGLRGLQDDPGRPA